jgi:type III secretory pathway component EscS
MNREKALKVVLAIVGMLFVSTLYWLVTLQEETLQMMLSLYATLGVFLLLAVRNPSAHRSLIAFTAWSSLAHAGVMAVQSRYDAGERMHLLIGTIAFGVIGIGLLALTLGKPGVTDADHCAWNVGRRNLKSET